MNAKNPTQIEFPKNVFGNRYRYRGLRGGNLYEKRKYMVYSNRDHSSQPYRGSFIGLRLVRNK